MVYDSLLDYVGNTPLVRFVPKGAQSDIEAFIKLEGCNPTGAVKDRALKHILQDKIATGECTPDTVLLDASSGSYACSMAFFGKMLGYDVDVTTGSKLTSDKEWFIRYYGANLTSVGHFTIEGNRHCQELYKQNPGTYCFLDQLHNWKNVEAHYTTTGPEILKDLPDVAAVAFSIGSGGTIAGAGAYLKEKKPDIKIIGVTSSSGAKIPGTGTFVDGDYVTPFIQQARDDKVIDFTAEVSLADAQAQIRNLNDQGFFAGIQSGAAIAGLLQGVEALGITGTVAVLSGDAGWKGTASLD